MLGPSTDKEVVLRQLMLPGMDVARLNFSHQSHAEQKVRSDTVKKLCQELDLPIALLLDTKGPEVHIRAFPTPQITLKQGQKFTLTIREADGTDEIVSVTSVNLLKDVDHGPHIPIDDGPIELGAEFCIDTDVLCTILNGGTLSVNKGVNVSGVQFFLPFISKRDQSDTAFAVQEDFGFIAAFFTYSAHDILKLRNELEKLNCHSMRVIVKIENREGVDNIDEIIRTAGGIMIARGDPGVETPLEEIPAVQKCLVKKGYSGGMQIITATQMLDSMMKNPRPIRAEATDMASAIYDDINAIMLSGGTTAGKYPIESLKTMSIIAKRIERDINYKSRFAQLVGKESSNVTSAIFHTTYITMYDLGAVAIITVSKSGRIARMVLKYRPARPITSGTTSETVRRQMNLSWGVILIMVGEQTNTDKLFNHVVKVSRDRGLVKDGDVVVIMVGAPMGFPGTTNPLKVQMVGDILVPGHGVNQSYARGNLCACQTEKEAWQRSKLGDALVLPHTTNELMELICLSAAIVTEQDGLSSHAAIAGMALNKPVIVNVENATQLLKSGTTATVDAMRGIVYSGIHKQEEQN